MKPITKKTWRQVRKEYQAKYLENNSLTHYFICANSHIFHDLWNTRSDDIKALATQLMPNYEHSCSVLFVFPHSTLYEKYLLRLDFLNRLCDGTNTKRYVKPIAHQ